MTAETVPRGNLDWVTAQGLTLALTGDGIWPDLAAEEPRRIELLPVLAVLTGGTAGGRPSVALRLDLPAREEGGADSVVVLELTLRTFVAIANALEERYRLELSDAP